MSLIWHVESRSTFVLSRLLFSSHLRPGVKSCISRFLDKQCELFWKCSPFHISKVYEFARGWSQPWRLSGLLRSAVLKNVQFREKRGVSRTNVKNGGAELNMFRETEKASQTTWHVCWKVLLLYGATALIEKVTSFMAQPCGNDTGLKICFHF